jgi:uncharacterized membrane protein YfhO
MPNQPVTEGYESPALLPLQRPSPDRIEVGFSAETDGWVRLLESFDEGWTASLDGAPVPPERVDGVLLAVSVPAGVHRLSFEYRTPGAIAGSLMSLAALALGLALAARLTPKSGS